MAPDIHERGTIVRGWIVFALCFAAAVTALPYAGLALTAVSVRLGEPLFYV